MNVVFFGDSITQGYWGIHHGWVDRVRMYYSKLLFAKDEYHGVYNLGIDGDTTEDVLNRIKSELQARIRPNHTVMPVVAIQIGVNDHIDKTTQPEKAMAEYKIQLQAMIDSIKGLYSKVVFVGGSSCDETKTTPVSWGDYYYTNQSVKAHEVAMKEVAERNHATFIPVFDEFKNHIDQGEDLLADGLHPNDAGHELMFQIIMPKLRELLR